MDFLSALRGLSSRPLRLKTFSGRQINFFINKLPAIARKIPKTRCGETFPRKRQTYILTHYPEAECAVCRTNVS